MVPPDEFIQVAESCGLILSLGDWVMERACAQLASWRELYGYDFIVAINLSAAQLCDPLLVDKLQELVVRYALPADRIELELTESMLVEDMNQALDVLHALEAIGIQLSIDDFGAGYSNLAQLRQLPIKRLKIDPLVHLGHRDQRQRARHRGYRDGDGADARHDRRGRRCGNRCPGGVSGRAGLRPCKAGGWPADCRRPSWKPGCRVSVPPCPGTSSRYVKG